MTNKEKYEGKTVKVYAPLRGSLGGRLLDILTIEMVYDDDSTLYEVSKISGIKTAYYLRDGIELEISN